MLCIDVQHVAVITTIIEFELDQVSLLFRYISHGSVSHTCDDVNAAKRDNSLGAFDTVNKHSLPSLLWLRAIREGP